MERTIDFEGWATRAWVAGDEDSPGKVPVLCLHGGPGVPSTYFKPLENLARTGRRIGFYNQVGCGTCGGRPNHARDH